MKSYIIVVFALMLILPFASALCLNDYTYNVTEQKCLNATLGDPTDPVGDNSMIFFSFLFIVFLAFLAYIIIDGIAHAISLDFDIKDLAINYGIYFAVIGLYYAESSYFGDLQMNNFLNWIIDIGAITQVFLPTIYFILTLTVGSWMKGRVQGVDY